MGQGRDVRSPWGHYTGKGAQVRQFCTEMGGVLPGLSDKTNGLPIDDMSMWEDTRTKFSPASPRWGPRGRNGDY